MPSLLLNWRLWACLLLVAVGGVAGWKLKPVPSPVVQTVDVEKVVTRTVVVEKRPDGTVTETTTDSTSESKSNSTIPARPSLPIYSVAATASMLLSDPSRKPDISIMAYRRFGDTNAWGGVGYSQYNKAVLIGVRVDF